MIKRMLKGRKRRLNLTWGKANGSGEVVGTSTGQARRKAAILDMVDVEEGIRGIPDILELT